MHFAIGRAPGGEGTEVEIEASSFVSQAAKETLALMKALEEDENDSREESLPCGSTRSASRRTSPTSPPRCATGCCCCA